MDGVPLADRGAAFRAWTALWQGALAAHNRSLSLEPKADGWRISAS
jgi:hypothetical protein